MMEGIIDFGTTFNFNYAISVCCLSFILISLLDNYTPTNLQHHVAYKRIITAGIGFVLGVGYTMWDTATFSELLVSFSMTILAYDYVIKLFISRFKLNNKNKRKNIEVKPKHNYLLWTIILLYGIGLLLLLYRLFYFDIHFNTEIV